MWAYPRTFPPAPVNTRFNNKPDLRSFIQVVKRQDDEKNVEIVFTDETINIELPVDMFTDFVAYNQQQYRGIFYTSLIFNALVKGILNIEKNDGSTWADSIKAIMETAPSTENNAYGSPYDLLFKSINELQN